MKKDEQVSKEERRLDIRNGVEYCIHNMPKETCSFCSGDYNKEKQKEKKRRECRIKSPEEVRLQFAYDRAKEGFSSFRDLWEESEVSYVDGVFKGVGKGGSKFRELVLQASLKLERTKGAIVWMYRHLFQANVPYHRSKLVISYMK